MTALLGRVPDKETLPAGNGRSLAGWAAPAIAALLACHVCPLHAAGDRRAVWDSGRASQARPISDPVEVGRPMSLDVTVGAEWVGPVSLGASTASLTPNQAGTSDRFTFFRSDARLLATPAVTASAGLALTRIFAVEGRAAVNRPTVRVRISNDAEQAPDVAFNAERLTQYLIGAALVAHLRRLGFAGGRAVPFIVGGAEYLRQLHQERSLLETGQVYYAGGGLKYVLKSRPRSRISGLGFRIDARVSLQRHGFLFDGNRRAWGAVGGGLLVVFSRRPPEVR